MARKDKLYTVNKFNRPAFMPKEENLFLNGGNANALAQADYQKNPWNYTQDYMYGNGPSITDQYLNSKNAFGISKRMNPFSKANLGIAPGGSALKGVGSAMGSALIGGVAGMGAQIIGDTIGGIAGAIGNGVGNLLGGGKKSGVGNAVQSVTGGLGDIVGGVPIVGGLAKGALNLVGGIVGGGVNALVGTKVDQKKLQENRAGTSAYNNFTSNATSLDAISGPTAQANVQNAFSGGAFKKGWARRNNAQMKEDRIDARQFAFNSVENNANNLVKDQLNDALANYSAFGGPIDFNDRNMGAIEYGFMSDYLDNGRKKIESKNTMNNLFAGVPSSLFADGGGIHIKHPGRLTALKERTGKTEAELYNDGNPAHKKMVVFARNSRKWHADGGPLFAFGGDMATNSSDFSTGLMHIDAGGSHEENKYDGVQLGTDSEGTPNLVEENEVVFNDYVFSNRINIDATTKEKFHLPKKKDITYADLAKRLEKEISERPNDPISKAGFTAQMQTLEEQQERQKQEMEAQRAKEAFESLSPEEQVAVMQQASEQAAQGQQLAAEQQAAMQQQVSPEEAAMIEQTQAQEVKQQQLAEQQAAVAALGGRLVKAGDVPNEGNRFDWGGKKAKKATQKYNKDWFLAQAKSLGMIGDDATDIDGWTFNPNDPETNLSTFNNLYKTYQRNKALETYRTGQRKSKENELFGDKGLYRYSDDKSKIFKTRVNDSDRVGWINADYTGALDNNGNLKGFLSQEDYDKLSDKDKEAYKRINERAGDKMYDFRGKAIEDLYNGNVEDILGTYNYDDGFKWNDRDAQILQYPVDLDKSNLSYLRYVPALGGAFGFINDVLSNPDYSNAAAIERAGSVTPAKVSPHYIGDYMTYKPNDPWFYTSPIMAQANATQRAINNKVSPSKGAETLANSYNTIIGLGNATRQQLDSNFQKEYTTKGFNRGTNQFNAEMGFNADKANQEAISDAQKLGLHGTIYGSRMRDDIDARRSASMSANLSNLLQSIGNIGEEAYDEDRLKWLEKTGVLKSKSVSADGGKLKKKGKRGLTF